MSYARVTVAGQTWIYSNVVKVTATPLGQHSYLHIHLSAHPSLVHFWMGPGTRTSVLLAVDGEAFTAALREEMAEQIVLANEVIAEIIHEERAARDVH